MITIQLPMLEAYNPDADDRYSLAPLMLEGYDYEQDRAILQFRANPGLDYKIFHEEGRITMVMRTAQPKEPESKEPAKEE